MSDNLTNMQITKVKKEEKYIGNNQEHGGQLHWFLLAFDSVLLQVVVK